MFTFKFRAFRRSKGRSEITASSEYIEIARRIAAMAAAHSADRDDESDPYETYENKIKEA